MIQTNDRKVLVSRALLLVALITGCDDKSTQLAREAADRQARQNTQMAELNQEVAAGSHQQVEADAKARQEILGVHHDLQAERTRLDTGFSQLEAERRQIAAQRQTSSAFETVANASGYVFLVVAVLGLCWYALIWARHTDTTDAEVSEILIGQIISDHPSKLGEAEKPLLGRSQNDQSERLI